MSDPGRKTRRGGGSSSRGRSLVRGQGAQAHGRDTWRQDWCAGGLGGWRVRHAGGRRARGVRDAGRKEGVSYNINFHDVFSRYTIVLWFLWIMTFPIILLERMYGAIPIFIHKKMEFLSMIRCLQWIVSASRRARGSHPDSFIVIPILVA